MTSLVEQPGAVREPPRRGGRGRGHRTLWIGVLGFLVLCVLRSLFDAQDLTSSGAVRAAITVAIPIGMAGLGGLWSERAGIVNIGLEGMLIAGTLFGAWAGYQWGPWVGVGVAVVAGMVFGAVHAVATVTFAVDHIVSGVAINILAVGIGGVLGEVFFGDLPGLSARQSPRVPDITTLRIPGLSDGLETVEGKGILVVSDLAGVLGGVVTGVSLLTILAVALFPVSYYLLWRTGFGLRLRSCGENPTAAESLGVDVYRFKYIAVIVSGGLAGLGGAYLVTVASGGYLEGQTGGRGFIGLAAMIFGNWRPGGLAAGALLFGYADALRLRGGGETVPALLVFVTVAMVVLAIRAVIAAVRAGDGLGRRVQPAGWWLGGVLAFAAGIAVGVRFDGWGTVWPVAAGLVAFVALALIGVRRQRGSGAGNLTLYIVSAVVLVVWSASGVGIPAQFVSYMSYIVTILVLAFATQRLRMPAADGLPYRRGQTG